MSDSVLILSGNHCAFSSLLICVHLMALMTIKGYNDIHNTVHNRVHKLAVVLPNYFYIIFSMVVLTIFNLLANE